MKQTNYGSNLWWNFLKYNFKWDTSILHFNALSACCFLINGNCLCRSMESRLLNVIIKAISSKVVRNHLHLVSGSGIQIWYTTIVVSIFSFVCRVVCSVDFFFYLFCFPWYFLLYSNARFLSSPSPEFSDQSYNFEYYFFHHLICNFSLY